MFNILHTKTLQKRMEEKTKEYKQRKKSQIIFQKNSKYIKGEKTNKAIFEHCILTIYPQTKKDEL